MYKDIHCRQRDNNSQGSKTVIKDRRCSVTIFAALVMSLIISMAVYAGYSNDYRYWSQSDTGYTNTSYYAMKDFGCFVVAQAKLIYASGVDTSSSFNPDRYYEWEVNNGRIANYSNIEQLYPVYQGPLTYASQKGRQLNYVGTHPSPSAADIIGFVNQGYYIIVKLNGGAHYAFVDNAYTKQNGVPWIDESSKDGSYKGPRPLSSYGTWNECYVYSGNNPSNYTITFDPCGGSCTLTNATVISNKPNNYAVNGNGFIPQKSGARFLGWYDKAANPIYDEKGYAVPGKYWTLSGNSASPKECNWIYSGDVTAYAWWGYTITFNAQGGSVNQSSIDVIRNMPSNWAINIIPTKAGATFCGWYDTNGKVIYDEKGYAAPGNYWALTGNSASPKECKWIFDGNVTAYARWKYTITFNAQGGSGSLSTINVMYQTPENWAISNTPTKSGCEFLGWYDSAGNQIYDVSGFAVPGKYWELMAQSHPKECRWIFNGNVTAYAKWKDNTHTHSYTHYITKATVSAAGKEYDKCSCGSVINETTIARINTVTLNQTTYEYDGAEKQPSVTVKDANNATISSANYSVSYKNNVNPGTATATVTFKGTKYEGTVTRDFTISSSGSEGDEPNTENNTSTGTQTQKDSQIAVMDNAAKALPENGDPAGSTFSILQVKGKKVKKTSIMIAWKAVPKATGYVVYGAPCGSKYGKLKDVAGTSFTQGGLKKGTYYKYFVVAHDRNGKILASSKTIHIATSGGKKGNTKSVKLNKKKATLKKGKTVKLKATLKNGKLKVSKHRKVAYETDNPKVATVSKSGKVKAVGKGKCTIYAYAQNGVFAKCKITVK